MHRTVLVIVALIAAVIATPVYAVVPDEDSAVSKNFKSIGRELRSLGRISDPDEMVAKLETFHKTLVANREEVPSFMEAGTEQHAEFQSGVDEFIGKVEAAIALAKAGDLDGAKEVASGFRDLKEKYHEQFEIEED